MRRIDLSVVIPVYDEAANLDALLGRCLSVLRGMDLEFELILVDDGSLDASTSMIQAAAETESEVIGVLLNRNYGQHAAIMAGFQQALGRMVVTLDADLQNPPEEIPQIVAKLQVGHDVVGSVRMRRQDSLFRRKASAAVNAIVRRSTGVGMRDYGCMLRGYRREIIDAILACREKTTFIPVLANAFASNPAEIEVRHDSRQDGQSKYGLVALVRLQFDLVTSMTTFPIRVLTLIGGAMAAMGFGLSALILVLRVMHGPAWAAQGVFTLMAVVIALMGIQLLGLGLIGEYIGRIFLQVRDRPAYWVKSVCGAPSRHDERVIKEAVS